MESSKMKDETLAAPIYHGFLPPKIGKGRSTSPRLYTQIGEKIHLTFLPLRPDCRNDPPVGGLELLPLHPHHRLAGLNNCCSPH